MTRIAIIGRPNVGKSTLFNRLAGQRLALVNDRPGVTRDWRETNAELMDLRFKLVDTAGLEGFETNDIFQQILKQTDQVIEQADIILFMVDGQEGILSSDIKLAEKLRSCHKCVLLLVNKAENTRKAFGLNESHRLGLGEPLAISAIHGDGIESLYQALRPYIKSSDLVKGHNEDNVNTNQSIQDLVPSEAPLSLVIVGRPNAGKSTLINHFLGTDRLIACDQPGVTRDAITVPWSYKGRIINLVDTAGIRKRARVSDDLEKASVTDAFKAIQYAHVVVLLVDARSPLDKQDLLIASRVIDEGRCLVIGLNKWDIAETKNMDHIKHTLQTSLSQVRGLPCIPISAKNGRNLGKLMQAVFDVYMQWNRRLSTGKLNQWLAQALERHPAPLCKGVRVRPKYMTQIKTRPPTFVMFVSKPTELPESYNRYLIGSLQQNFKMSGVPMRLYLRKGKNPYIDKK